MFLFSLISLYLQILSWCFQLCLLCLRYAFHVCSGLILAYILPSEEYAFLGFCMGIAIAIAVDLMLSRHTLFYRQLVFGAVGFCAALLLGSSSGDGNILAITTLGLTGLCVWQAQRAR